MERTYFVVREISGERFNVETIEEVKKAFRRGCDVLEIEEFYTKANGTTTRLTISSEVDPDDFIFQ